MTLSGRVVRKTFAPGSHSEHPAVMLAAGDRDYVLRFRGGPAFSDPNLEELIGKNVEVEGDVRNYVVLIDRWRESAPS